ncbi:MAG: NAD(P)H-binding protein [Pseudomonadota bacterium]
MKIIVFGSTGDVGSRIAKEARRRGHEVTGVVRDEQKLDHLPDGVVGRLLDVNDAKGVAAAAAGNDIVISALRPPEGEESTLPALTKSILNSVHHSNKRVLIVGGAANLLMPNDSGYTVLTAPNFLPDSVKPIAKACFSQFMMCGENEDVDWVYFSPPALLRPGVRTGQYRRGSDTLIVDKSGASQISMEDFAIAVLDEAENPRANVRRVTVAY